MQLSTNGSVHSDPISEIESLPMLDPSPVEDGGADEEGRGGDPEPVSERLAPLADLRLGEGEGLGDLVLRQPVPEQGEHLGLDGVRRVRPRTHQGEGEGGRGQAVVEVESAPERAVDRVAEPFEPGPLEDEPVEPRLEEGDARGGVVARGEGHEADLGVRRAERGDEGRPAPGHRRLDDDEVGLGGGHGPPGLGRRSGDRDDLGGRRREDGPERVGHDGVGVHQHGAGGRRGWGGAGRGWAAAFQGVDGGRSRRAGDTGRRVTSVLMAAGGGSGVSVGIGGLVWAASDPL